MLMWLPNRAQFEDSEWQKSGVGKWPGALPDRHEIRAGRLALQDYGLLLEFVLTSFVLEKDDEFVAKVLLLGALFDTVPVVVPRSVPYWSVVPPCSLLQPANNNAAPRMRIAFFMVQSFVTFVSLSTFSVLL